MIVSDSALYSRCADICSRAADILNVNGYGKLLRSCCKSGVTCDHCKVCGAVVPFDYIKACNASYNTVLDNVCAERRSFNKFGAFENVCICIRSYKQITSAIIGNICLAHGCTDINDSAVDRIHCKHVHIHRCRACKKSGRTVIVLSSSKGIACTVEPVCNKIVGDKLSIVAVNDLIYSLILGDREILVSSAACACLDAVCLVVIGNSHLGISYGYLYNACRGAAFIVGVEYNAVFQLVFLADFRKYKGRISFL